MAMLTPYVERQLFAHSKVRRIVGIDEVGRGCLAGPVAVGAYLFQTETRSFSGVNDSKLLLPQAREKLHARLSRHTYKVYYASAEEIDDLGIARAIEKLIQNAIDEFDDTETIFWVDGRFREKFKANVIQIIGGDNTRYSIAAASILAKVERDRLMCQLAQQYSDYGFDLHKGYGTKLHRERIDQFGVCDLHRRSFHPVSSILGYNITKS
jgi:ribonuclease HII